MWWVTQVLMAINMQALQVGVGTGTDQFYSDKIGTKKRIS